MLLKEAVIRAATLRAATPGGGESQADREHKGIKRMKDIRHPFILTVERFEEIDGKTGHRWYLWVTNPATPPGSSALLVKQGWRTPSSSVARD